MGHPRGLDRKNPNLFFVGDYAFPNFCKTNRPMEEHVECIKALELRDDDVLLLAYPKSGTHWLWEVGSMLLTGKANNQTGTKHYTMLEAAEVEKIQQQQSPRLLNTHLPPDMLPREVKDKKIKVIHVYRNVKDVTVSLFHHMRQTDVMRDGSLQDAFEWVLSESNGYFSYMEQMDEFFKQNLDIPMFRFAYEDVKEDPVKMISRIAEFLGVPNTPEFYRQVAEATNFHKMKQASVAKRRPGNFPPIQYYRKGEVGDWKNHLTVAQSERLDAAIKQLDGCNFRFRYTL